MSVILAAAGSMNFLTKRKILDLVEDRHGKTLTHGWIHEFMSRHQHEVGCGEVYSQEDPDLQIPRFFLQQYFALVE
jgi:hypothetical protein